MLGRRKWVDLQNISELNHTAVFVEKPFVVAISLNGQPSALNLSCWIALQIVVLLAGLASRRSSGTASTSETILLGETQSLFDPMWSFDLRKMYEAFIYLYYFIDLSIHAVVSIGDEIALTHSMEPARRMLPLDGLLSQFVQQSSTRKRLEVEVLQKMFNAKCRQ